MVQGVSLTISPMYIFNDSKNTSGTTAPLRKLIPFIRGLKYSCMTIQFPCKHCAKCCSLLKMEGWTGISLFPWEVQLFPEEDIIPSLGLGSHPDDPKFRTILYTYHASGCIHLKEKKCVIHSQRPLICRSYPFRITKQGAKKIYIIAPECTASQDWPERKTIEQRYVEMDAADLIGDHLSRFYKANESKWRFNQGVGWNLIGRNKTLD